MSIIELGLIILSGLPIAATLLLVYKLKSKGNPLIGKPSIHSLVFYPAKMSIGIILTTLFIASISNQAFLHFPFLIQYEIADVQKLLSLILLLGANLLLLSGYYSLNTSTRVGLPTDEHQLTTNGAYRISRNPMYASFLFFNTACFLLVPSLLILSILLFNTTSHHLIIRNEERFLERLFKTEYTNYKNKVARYL